MAQLKYRKHLSAKMQEFVKECMLQSSVKDFIEFVKANTYSETDRIQFVPEKGTDFVSGKIYNVVDVNEKNDPEYIGDQFVISNNNRVFYALDIFEIIEIIN